MSSELVPADLLGDLGDLIEGARQRAAVAVNQEMVVLYWNIGRRIHMELLHEERATYGREIVSTLSRQLTQRYGRGFSRPNLHRMIQFASELPDEKIVSTLSAQLSWSHFTLLLQVKESIARDFYAEMCRVERWSVRTLRSKIGLGFGFSREGLVGHAWVGAWADIRLWPSRDHPVLRFELQGDGYSGVLRGDTQLSIGIGWVAEWNER